MAEACCHGFKYGGIPAEHEPSSVRNYLLSLPAISRNIHLKGYLVFCGMAPPRMHDLDELCKLSLKFSNTFKNIADQCSDLTAYGVQPRYPMELILDKEDIQQALDSAKAVKDFVVAIIEEKIAQEQKQAESKTLDE